MTASPSASIYVASVSRDAMTVNAVFRAIKKCSGALTIVRAWAIVQMVVMIVRIARALMPTATMIMTSATNTTKFSSTLVFINGLWNLTSRIDLYYCFKHQFPKPVHSEQLRDRWFNLLQWLSTRVRCSYWIMSMRVRLSAWLPMSRVRVSSSGRSHNDINATVDNNHNWRRTVGRCYDNKFGVWVTTSHRFQHVDWGNYSSWVQFWAKHPSLS